MSEIEFISISPLELFKRLGNEEQVYVYFNNTGKMKPLIDEKLNSIYNYIWSNTCRFYRVREISDGRVVDLKWQ